MFLLYKNISHKLNKLLQKQPDSFIQNVVYCILKSNLYIFMAEKFFWSHSPWSLELFIFMDLYFYGFLRVCAFGFNRNVRNHTQTSWSHFKYKKKTLEKMKRSERPLKYNSAFLGCLHFQPEKGGLKIFLQNIIVYYSCWFSLVLSALEAFEALGIVNIMKRKYRYNLLLRVDFRSCSPQHKWFVDVLRMSLCFLVSGTCTSCVTCTESVTTTRRRPTPCFSMQSFWR